MRNLVLFTMGILILIYLSLAKAQSSPMVEVRDLLSCTRTPLGMVCQGKGMLCTIAKDSPVMKCSTFIDKSGMLDFLIQDLGVKNEI